MGAWGPCHPGNMYTVIQVNNNEFMIAGVKLLHSLLLAWLKLSCRGRREPCHRGNTYTVIQVKNNEFSIVSVKLLHSLLLCNTCMIEAIMQDLIY